jgi:hypothetical protein
MLPNLLKLAPEELTLFDKKIKTRLFFGSTHQQVPVKPVWPNVSGDADRQG